MLYVIGKQFGILPFLVLGKIRNLFVCVFVCLLRFYFDYLIGLCFGCCCWVDLGGGGEQIVAGVVLIGTLVQAHKPVSH